MSQGSLFPPEPPFSAVKREWREKLESGEDGLCCPCCGQNTKIYKRRIHASLASLLVTIYKMSREEIADWRSQTEWPWIHILKDIIDPTPRRVAHDYYVLAYFDLIESKPNDDDPSKKDSGFWRLTNRGARFVQRHIRLPKHVYVFDNTRIRFSEDSCDIVDCFADPFHYELLMRPAPIALGDKAP